MALSIEHGAERVVSLCLETRADERVVVLCDEGGDRVAAEAIADAATRLGASTELVMVTGAQLGAEVDPSQVPAQTLAADVIIGVTGVSVYHSVAGRMAAERGARVLAMTGGTASMLREGAIEADFASIEPRCVALADALSNASTLHLTSPAGTDLTAHLTGRSGETCTGRAANPGDRTGFPDIEAFIAPLETGSNGRLVVDASSTTHGLVDAPITVDVVDGVAQSFTGGDHAREIFDLLQSHGPAALVLAEFGFGLNPSARVIGNIIEDEATYGTGHVAFGSNVGFGGSNPAPLHMDLVYWKPTLVLDGVTVIEDGVLQLR